MQRVDQPRNVLADQAGHTRPTPSTFQEGEGRPGAEPIQELLAASPHNHIMTTVTLTSKGQLTLPRPIRDALGLAPGARLQASIDRQGRLVLVPSKYEPEELFLHRPKVNRCLSLEQMEEAIAAAAGNPNDREDA
jgi:antitoxin PrlF